MVLIVGGLGFLGTNLARHLADRGERVLIGRHRSSAVPSFLQTVSEEKIQIIPLDVLKVDAIQSVIEDHGVASIVNMAAIHEAKGDPYRAFQVNVQGQVNLLEAIKNGVVKRLTFVSSIGVYRGTAQKESVKETDPILLDAKSTYIPATKKAAEALSFLYAHSYGIDIVVARVGNVYGPAYTSGRNPILTMVKNALNGTPTRLSLSEDSEYNYIYAKDCVRALALLHLTSPLKHRIYNIATGRGITLGELAGAIKATIPEAQIEFQQENALVEKRPVMEIIRIKEELGFVPEYDLEQGVREYIGWLKQEGC
jgi:UDP-glucose 4-epimerase